MKKSSISLVAVMLVVLASGCVSSGPDPEVVDSELDRDLSGAFTGTATVESVVVNNGSEGDVEVTAEATSGDGVIIDRQSETVEMKEDEKRQVEIDVEFTEDAEDYDVTARPAE